MRKKKFSKERFYRRLEAQNKKAVSKSETDWDVMQSGYPDCLIYPDILSRLKVEIIKSRRRHGAGGFTGAVILDDHLKPDDGLYIPKDIAEKLGANKPLFNAQNSQQKTITITINTTHTREEEQVLTDAYRKFFGDDKKSEPKPEFVPPPQPIKIGASEPESDSGFSWCLLHMAAIVACALLLCGILQKLSH